MAAKKVVGIARLVIARRERAVMLEPRGKGIVLWTLRFGNEVREADAYFGDIQPGKGQPKMLQMITDLIEQRSRDWSPDLVTDPVQDELKALIAAKRKKGGKAPARKTEDDEPAGGSNVISLMDALKSSLDKANRKKK